MVEGEREGEVDYDAFVLVWEEMNYSIPPTDSLTHYTPGAGWVRDGTINRIVTSLLVIPIPRGVPRRNNGRD